jgi:hypothetical protein
MGCNSWTSDRKEAANGKGAEVFSDSWGKSWILGYLSALNMSLGEEKDTLAAVDGETVFLWVDKYCDKNPNKQLYEAALDLFIKLKKISK